MEPLHVVILNWNRPAATLERLQHLRGWQRLHPTIWVVDNGSRDNSVAQLRRQFPNLRLLNRHGTPISGGGQPPKRAAPPLNLIWSEQNHGFAGGNNLALRHIKRGHVLLLNNDAHISEEAVMQLRTVLQTQPHVGVVGPVFVAPDEPTRWVGMGGRDIGRHIDTHRTTPPKNREQPYPVDYVSGTAALLRAAQLTQIGLFDERYFFSGEMADWCERLKRQRFQCVILPMAHATHESEQAGALRHSLYAYYILRNRFLFVRSFRGVGWRLLWYGYGLAFAMQSLRHGRWATARAVCWAMVDALRGRFGGRNQLFLGGK